MSKWEKVKLGDIADIQSGGTPSRSHTDYWKDGDIPWVKISDIKSKYVCKTEEKITVKGLNNSSAKLFKKGTLLYTIFATLGAVGILDIDAATNQAIAGITLRNKDIDVDYVYYFLQSIRSRINNIGRGVAQNNINLSILKNIQIPLPPIETQKQIAKVLDTVSELLNMRKQQLTELDKLIKSIFYDMFGDPALNDKRWEVGKIKDLTLKTQYGTSAKASTEKLKYPILRMNNITYQGEIDFTDLKYIDLDDKEKDKYLVHQGEILFNRTNSKELVGKTAVYREKEPMAYAGYLIRLTPNERANSEFISAFLNSQYGKKLLRNMAKNIVGMANINAQELENIDIYIPPISLQNKFSEIVIEIEEQKKLVRKTIDETQNLFGSLMSEYFD